MRQLACSLFAFGVIFAAQAPPPRARHTLSGSVTNAATGEPVHQALVRINMTSGINKPVTVLTGPDGAFQFEGLPASEITLIARKPGFTTQDSVSADLREGPRKLSIALAPLASVRGRVVDQYGEPISMVVVHAMRPTVVEGRRKYAMAGWSRTNDRGDYLVTGLSPGTYYMKVVGRPRNAGAVVGEFATPPSVEALVPAYYPAARTASEATPFPLAGGAVAEANFTVPLVNGRTITGRVVNATPYGGLHLQVLAGEEDIESSQSVVNMANGSFRIQDLTDGEYTLRVTAGQREARTRAIERIVVAGRDIQNLAVQTSPSVTVKGRFRFEGNSTGRRRRFETATLVLLDGNSWTTPERLSSKTGDEDYFEIPNVLAGRYKVEALGGGYVASMSAGGRSLMPSREFVIAPGAAPPEIEITLGTDGGTIGVTLPAEWSKGQQVAVVPDAAVSASNVLIQDAYGNDVWVPDVPPGDYRVHVWAKESAPEYADSQVLRGLVTSGQLVTVTANGTHKVVWKGER